MPPPAPWPSQPQAATSGTAVAALVLGIVALLASLTVLLFFVALPAGVVAVILGIVAIRGTRQSGQRGRGMAIAGLTCGAVGTLISLVIVAVIILIADEFQEPELIEREQASPDDFVISDQECWVSTGSRSSQSGLRSPDTAHAGGRIVNQSGEPQAFVVHVTFLDQDGEKVGEGDDGVATLEDGDSGEWDLIDTIGRSSGITSGELECAVSRVNLADEVED